MAEEIVGEWATPKILAQIETAFSESSIRWHIFNSRRNGLDQHIRRIGRKVVINVAGFRDWIKSHA